MKCVLLAERAVLIELDTLCIVLLILHSRIVSLLAFLTMVTFTLMFTPPSNVLCIYRITHIPYIDF